MLLLIVRGFANGVVAKKRRATWGRTVALQVVD